MFIISALELAEVTFYLALLTEKLTKRLVELT